MSRRATNLSDQIKNLVRLSVMKSNTEKKYKDALAGAVDLVPEGSTYTNSKGSESVGYRDENGTLMHIVTEGRDVIDEELLMKVNDSKDVQMYAKLMAKYRKTEKGRDYWQFKANNEAVVEATIKLREEGVIA
jgi:hypothetical protein